MSVIAAALLRYYRKLGNRPKYHSSTQGLTFSLTLKEPQHSISVAKVGDNQLFIQLT